MLRVLIAVHRGCISEFCGFRQRRARWAQKLKSTTREEDLKVVEYLGGKAVYEKTQLQTESLRSSVKLCQEGIEPVQGVHRRRTLL
jgi:hypothetical protein